MDFKEYADIIQPPEKDSKTNGAADTEAVLADAESLSIAQHVHNCCYCVRETNETCLMCHKYVCLAHLSEIDPQFCQDCVAKETSAVQVTPLVSEDGVTHEGRNILPIGSIYREKTLSRAISEMSDEQLHAFVAGTQIRVKELERGIEYARIALGTAQVEREDRDSFARRRLRGIRVKGGTVKIGGGEAKERKKQDPIALAVAALVACGLNETQAKAIVALKMGGKV